MSEREKYASGETPMVGDVVQHIGHGTKATVQSIDDGAIGFVVLPLGIQWMICNCDLLHRERKPFDITQLDTVGVFDSAEPAPAQAEAIKRERRICNGVNCDYLTHVKLVVKQFEKVLGDEAHTQPVEIVAAGIVRRLVAAEKERDDAIVGLRFRREAYEELQALNADVIADRDGWKESAAQFLRNQEFYHGILKQIGEGFGAPAFTSDDGSVQDEVLALKVPELVAEQASKLAATEAERDEARKARQRLPLVDQSWLPVGSIVHWNQLYGDTDSGEDLIWITLSNGIDIDVGCYGSERMFRVIVFGKTGTSDGFESSVCETASEAASECVRLARKFASDWHSRQANEWSAEVGSREQRESFDATRELEERGKQNQLPRIIAYRKSDGGYEIETNGTTKEIESLADDVNRVCGAPEGVVEKLPG